RRLRDLADLTSRLLRPDAAIVAWSSGAVDELVDLRTCADVPTLRARRAPSCLFEQRRGTHCEFRVETIRVDAVEVGWSGFTPWSFEGSPHLLAYRAKDGEVALLRVRGDGSLQPVARSRWEPG